jgi:hypothetical protein
MNVKEIPYEKGNLMATNENPNKKSLFCTASSDQRYKEALDENSLRHKALIGISNGDIEPLVEFMRTFDRISNGPIDGLVLASLQHNPDSDWNFTFLKMKKKGKGKSLKHKAKKIKSDFQIFYYLLNKKIYVYGQGSKAKFAASEHFNCSESKIGDIRQELKKFC